MTVLAAGNGHELWYLTRSSGIVALVLLTGTLVLGIMSGGIVVDAALAAVRHPGPAPQRVAAGRALRRRPRLHHRGRRATCPSRGSTPWSRSPRPYKRFWLGLGAVAFDLILALGPHEHGAPPPAPRARGAGSTGSPTPAGRWPWSTGSAPAPTPPPPSCAGSRSACVFAAATAVVWRLGRGWPAAQGRPQLGRRCAAAPGPGMAGYGMDTGLPQPPFVRIMSATPAPAPAPLADPAATGPPPPRRRRRWPRRSPRSCPDHARSRPPQPRRAPRRSALAQPTTTRVARRHRPPPRRRSRPSHDHDHTSADHDDHHPAADHDHDDTARPPRRPRPTTSPMPARRRPAPDTTPADVAAVGAPRRAGSRRRRFGTGDPRLLPTGGREDLAAHHARLGPRPWLGGPGRREHGRLLGWSRRRAFSGAAAPGSRSGRKLRAVADADARTDGRGQRHGGRAGDGQGPSPAPARARISSSTGRCWPPRRWAHAGSWCAWPREVDRVPAPTPWAWRRRRRRCRRRSTSAWRRRRQGAVQGRPPPAPLRGRRELRPGPVALGRRCAPRLLRGSGWPSAASTASRPCCRTPETMAQIALIGRFGPAWFRRAGPGGRPGHDARDGVGRRAPPRGHRDGAGHHRGRRSSPRSAGPTEPLGAVLFGGYGGSFVEAGAPWACASPTCPSTAVDATVGAGIVAAIPASACGIAETARVARWMADEGAGPVRPLRPRAPGTGRRRGPAGPARRRPATPPWPIAHIVRWCGADRRAAARATIPTVSSASCAAP